MTTLTELIDYYATGDPDKTASAVFDALGCPTKWRNLFYQVVREECRLRYRGFVRGKERSAGGGGAKVFAKPTGQTPRPSGTDQRCGANGCPKPIESTPRSAARSDWLAERFYNGTEYVVWGSATVADHQGRIAFLKSQRDGINDTIARHADAIKRIMTAGVSCLFELESVVEEDELLELGSDTEVAA